MTAFDRILAGLERWRDAVDRERDLVARLLARHGATPLLTTLLDDLELERRRVTDLLTRLSCERYDPALLFPVRPRRALKVMTLPTVRRRPRRGFEGFR